MKLIYSIYLIIIPLLSIAQGGLIIELGAELVLTNSPQIVIEDGYFKNDGSFSAGNSTVHITGTAATTNSTIGGVSLTAFNNLKINKQYSVQFLHADLVKK